MRRLGRYPIVVVLAAQFAWADSCRELSDVGASLSHSQQVSTGAWSADVGLAAISSPTSSGDNETDQERWQRIIGALCAIIPCYGSDPPKNTTESATLALHVMIDRYEDEGLAPNLTAQMILDGMANVAELIALLSGPEWSSLVKDAQERDELIGRLNGLLEFLAMLRTGHDASAGNR